MRSLLTALALLTATAAGAEDLNAFLKAATEATRATAPLRADGEIVTTSPDGTARDQIAVIRRPSGDLYIELHNAGVRVLLLADGKTAMIVPAKGASPEAFALDAPLGNSEFTREDLRLFKADRYRSPAIADRSSDEMTVSLTPDDSQYALQVITFERDRKLPLVVKNYKDTASNLVKMRRNGEWVSAGGVWVPRAITMENFPMRSTSSLTLRWQTTDDSAALFDPAALGKPSPLTWPSAGTGTPAPPP